MELSLAGAGQVLRRVEQTAVGAPHHSCGGHSVSTGSHVVVRAEATLEFGCLPSSYFRHILTCGVGRLSHVTHRRIVVEFLHFFLFGVEQLVDLLLDFLFGFQLRLSIFFALNELLKLFVHAGAKLLIHYV
jgi:hypothetical protein